MNIETYKDTKNINLYLILHKSIIFGAHQKRSMRKNRFEQKSSVQ